MKWKRAKDSELFPGITEDQLFEAVRELSRYGYPNPDREGCPPADRLRLLAEQSLTSNSDEDAEHVVHCSPCFVEYDRLRTAWVKRKRATWAAALSAAALLAFGIVSAAYLRSKPVPPPPGPVAGRPKDAQPVKDEVRLATLDLRPFDATRGASKEPARRVSLERSKLRLKVLLPVGSEPGRYVLQFRSQSGASQLQVAAEAAIINYITTIETEPDLRPLPTGPGVLAVRHITHSGWKTYPIEIR